MWPATVDATARPALLNGTCTRSRPSDRRKSSPTRCPGVPVPGEAKLYLPGLDLIRATRSLTVWAGSEGMHREHLGCSDRDRHRIEVLVGIIGDPLVERRVDDDVGRDNDEGIAVGRRLGALPHADIAAGSAQVLNVELFAETLGQLLCGEAREHVGRAAGCKRNDDPHGPRGIGLRPCHARCTGESGGAEGELQNLTAYKFHRVPHVSDGHGQASRAGARRKS